MRRMRKYRLGDLNWTKILEDATFDWTSWSNDTRHLYPENQDNIMLISFGSINNTREFAYNFFRPVIINHSDRFIRPVFYTDKNTPDEELEELNTNITRYLTSWFISNSSKFYQMYINRLDLDIVGNFSYDDSDTDTDNENKNYAVDFEEEGGLDTKTNSTVKSKSKSKSKNISGREKLKNWTNTQHNLVFKQLINELTETVSFLSWKDIEGCY